MRQVIIFKARRKGMTLLTSYKGADLKALKEAKKRRMNYNPMLDKEFIELLNTTNNEEGKEIQTKDQIQK